PLENFLDVTLCVAYHVAHSRLSRRRATRTIPSRSSPFDSSHPCGQRVALCAPEPYPMGGQRQRGRPAHRRTPEGSCGKEAIIFPVYATSKARHQSAAVARADTSGHVTYQNLSDCLGKPNRCRNISTMRYLAVVW